MMRQSPSRGSRGRGWKVKHALQICVLVGVCVWLAYQVKHSQEKKKALEESNLKVSDRMMEDGGGADILKLGRKDPHGNVVIIDTDNSSQGEEEENKEDAGAAEDENKQEEVEEERKGTEGHDTEENGEEKTETARHGEGSSDEESKGEAGDAGVLESQDHEGADGGSQEAREEHYKADDASSAVVRDAQEIAQEDEVFHTDENTGEQNEKAQVEQIGNGGGGNVTEDASNDIGGVHDNPANGESRRDNTSPLERESGSNLTVAAESDGHIEADMDTTSRSEELMEQQNNSTVSKSDDQLEQQTSSTETARDELMEAQNVSGGGDAETVESTTTENATKLDVASSEDQSKVQETRTLEDDSSNLESNSRAIDHNVQIEEQSKSTENVSDEQTQDISQGVSTESVESISGNATADASSVQDQNRVTEGMTLTEGLSTNTENIPTEETEKSNPAGVGVGADESQQQTSSSTESEENGDATAQGDGTSSSGDHLPNDATAEQEQGLRTDMSSLPEAETETAEALAAE